MNTTNKGFKLPTRRIELSSKVPSELTRDLTDKGAESLVDAILAGESFAICEHYPKKRYIPNPAMRAAIARLPTL